MILAINIIISVLAAYLIGALPTSYIMARIFKGVDIRDHGSGNVGATNVLRVVGRLPALITLIIDIAKGAAVVTLVAPYGHQFLPELDYEFYRILLGFCAITGHIWTVFLRFKGGKGVATTIGVLATLAPSIFIPSIIIWLAVFMITQYVSVASLAFGIAFPLFSIILNRSIYMVIFAVTLCILNSYKHRSNIKRLIRGEEPKTILRNVGDV